MSSAIDSVKLASFTSPQQVVEVLKDFLEQAKNIGLWVSDEQEEAFKKALLALEKQENLIKWLKNRIDANQKRCEWQLTHLDQPFGRQILDSIQQRVLDYKEVLGELR